MLLAEKKVPLNPISRIFHPTVLPAVYILATPTVTVTFRPIGDAVIVTVREGSPYGKRTEMTVEEARREWCRLKDLGLSEW